VNAAALLCGAALFAAASFALGLDLISALLISFFCTTIARKLLLDALLAHGPRRALP
jgi:hypothetical protein